MLICWSVQRKIHSGRPLGQPAQFFSDKKTGRRQTECLYLSARAWSVSSGVLTQHPHSAFIYLPLAGHCPACTFVIGVASSRKRAISWSAQSVCRRGDVRSVKICCVTTLTSSRGWPGCCFLLSNLLISKSTHIKSYLCFVLDKCAVRSFSRHCSLLLERHTRHCRATQTTCSINKVWKSFICSLTDCLLH